MTRRRKYLLLLIPITLLVLLWLALVSNWGLALGLRIAAAVIPGELSVRQSQGSLLGPIQLRSLRYHNAQVTVSIQQLDLEWRLRQLLRGKLSIGHLALEDIDINVQTQATSQTTQRATEKAPQPSSIILPIGLDIEQASLDKLTITTSDSSTPIVIDRVDLSASGNRQTIDIRQFVAHAYQSALKLAGTVSLTEFIPLDLTLDFSYSADATHHLNSSGSLKGDLRKLQTTQKLTGLVQAELVAEVKDVLSTLQWHAALNVTHLNIHELTAQSPPVVVKGKLTATGDLQTFHTESQLHAEEKSLGQVKLALRADSDLLLSAYRFDADGDFNGIDFPEGKLSVQGKGDLQHVDLSQLVIHVLNGDAQGTARIAWLPRFALNSNLKLHDIQTGMLSKQWPGQISARLSLDAEAKAKTTPFDFTLDKLAGTLRGFPLQGEAKGSWEQNLLALDKLQLAVGGTEVSAHGKLAQQWDLTFQAHSDDLKSLLPDAKGKFDLNGQLTGTPTLPRLILAGEASQLAYAKESIGALKLKLDLGLARNAVAQINLQLAEVQTHAGHWNSMRLQVAGSNAAQQASLDASDAISSLHAQWHGKFEPWRWQGSLEQLTLSQIDVGKWELQQPVSIALAKNLVSVSSLCLAQATSHLCSQIQWNHSHRQARIDGTAVRLSLFEPWLPQNIQLGGQLDVQGVMDLTAHDTLQGKLVVHSTDKSIVIGLRDNTQQITLGASSLTATLDSKGLHAALHLPLSAGGGIESEASMSGWSPQNGFPRTQAITASLTLDHIPAEMISRFSSELTSAKGYLQADLHVNGSLGKPNLRGTAQWHEGSLLLPVVGVNVHDIQAELKSAQFNKLDFKLQARSGKGDMQLDGHIRLDPGRGWPTQATLTSHDLEVSNIPEAYVLIDSKLKLRVQGNNMNIDGDITVPRASFKPHTLPQGTVPVSPDIVIIHAEKQTEKPTRWLITSHLRVQLSDQVDFNGFGIRGKLRGMVMLNAEPGQLVMAQGEISIVDGVYRMSGQDLMIRRGRMIFSNTFIDDPALDVEAVRNIENVTAGVRLKGTLKQPQLSIFSEPGMPETQALSYLILGHSSSQNTTAEGNSISNTATALGFVAGDYLEKGIGGRLGLDELRLDVNETTQNTSLMLGKYLSPHLIVRYYNGIAESSHLLQLEYQLSNRVQIQTESGYTGSQSTTGGDIFFTIE